MPTTEQVPCQNTEVVVLQRVWVDECNYCGVTDEASPPNIGKFHWMRGWKSRARSAAVPPCPRQGGRAAASRHLYALPPDCFCNRSPALGGSKGGSPAWAGDSDRAGLPVVTAGPLGARCRSGAAEPGFTGPRLAAGERTWFREFKVLGADWTCGSKSGMTKRGGAAESVERGPHARKKGGRSDSRPIA